ncbi:MAG: YraN family protein [Gammaproteobacteria bacterium]|nr:YraN family protein [Gammaproteobacteria bacterium]
MISKSSQEPDHLQKGKAFEGKALDFLESRGLSLVERNFSCRRGEIDLIMFHDQDLVFVEVRYRRNDAFGGAAASIGTKKQRKIRTAAEAYLQKNDSLMFKGCRFDVLAIEGEGEALQINWISDAF